MAPKLNTAILSAALLLCGLAACDSNGQNDINESWPDELALDSVHPSTILPTTRLSLIGDGFVGSGLGTSRIRLGGQNVFGEETVNAEIVLLLTHVSRYEAYADLNRESFAQLCPLADGEFRGIARLEVASLATSKQHQAQDRRVRLLCRRFLVPTVTFVEGGMHPLNTELELNAHSLLLNASEGHSALSINGCFLPDDAPPPCNQNGEQINDYRLPLTVSDRRTRSNATFLLEPALMGLRPGQLDAWVRVVNQNRSDQDPGGGAGNTVSTSSDEIPWQISLAPSGLSRIENDGTSLGGYVEFVGQGFVGQVSGEVTEIIVDGSFVPDDTGEPTEINVSLVTEFASGTVVRYLINEDDELARTVDARKTSGTITGVFTTNLSRGADVISLPPVEESFRIDPIKQVVYLKFNSGFTDALERFGLRKVEDLVRDRILEHAQNIFAGIGVIFRTEKPEDYELYSQVDLLGFDPNGFGLMGYDNTPGKDVGNLRLYDRIGGVHAITQQDGYPGYGGIFVDSFFAFSAHPPTGIEPHPGATPLFDQIFDPLRPDRGQPVRPGEALSIRSISDGRFCPAPPGDRITEMSCAVFVLGNIIGGTMAHEVAHSLGLADPEGSLFHNNSNEPNHLMDSGNDRPFHERAQLNGGGPEHFCRENYTYLRSILPSDGRDPMTTRQPCY